jgi:preprotein translocase subunit YajC
MEGDHVPLSAGEGGGGSYFGLVVILLLFAFMYFALIRPQNRRRREAMEMQARLTPGNEIVTVGGLYATVTSVNDDDTVTLEAAPGVSLRYARAAVARVITTPAEATPAAEDSDAAKTIEQA